MTTTATNTTYGISVVSSRTGLLRYLVVTGETDLLRTTKAFNATYAGRNNSSTQSSPIISGKIDAPLVLELFGASGADRLISDAKVGAKGFVAERTALLRYRRRG